jgi:4-cresol dehydrogenase (hydroxylating) flavoprotein subunit
MANELGSALRAWRQALGVAYVATDDATLDRYARSTQPRGTRPSAVVRPGDAAEVSVVVRIASRFGVPIYPISRGRNWGYGDACAVSDGEVIVDLSRMDRIWEVNEPLAYAVIEPGVTQGQLQGHLAERGYRLWLDVTGAGPDASVVGNTIERGFGHTPSGDHFHTSAGYQVVLADGRTLTTGFGHYASARATYVFKPGIGPSLDGLFTQSNLGVVTRMGVWLLPQPECMQGFAFSVPENGDLARIVEAIRPLRLSGIVQSTVHIANDLRVLSARSRYPWALTHGATPLPEALRRELREGAGLGAWNVLGGLYGTPATVAAGRKALRRALAGLAPIKFFDDRRLRLGDKLVAVARRVGLGGRLADQLGAVKPAFDLLKGVPSPAHLAGSGWRSRSAARADTVDPLDNGWGLFWLSPVLPMTGAAALELLHLVEPIFEQHGFEPLITMTSITPRALCCVMTVAYDKDSAREAAAAEACYTHLFEVVMQAGLVPYRAGIQSMAGLTADADTFWDVVAAVKQTLDPSGVLAPRRYSRQ